MLVFVVLQVFLDHNQPVKESRSSVASSKAAPQSKVAQVIMNILTDYFPIDKNYMTNAINKRLQNLQLGG